LFAIATLTLVVRPQVVWGFQHAFLPVPSKWIYSGCFFALGVWFVYRGEVERLCQRCLQSGSPLRWCGLSGMFAAAAYGVGMWTLQKAEAGQPVGPAARWTLALLPVAAATLLSWVTLFASMWFSRQTIQNGRVVTSIRFLATASFWIYLTHHPIVAMAHVSLKHAAPETWPVVKMLVVTALAIGVPLASYHVLVAHSWLGRVLGIGMPAIKPLQESPVSLRIDAAKPDDALRRAA
ncbi:MAG: acyltransferase family protein, partial [Planctomycetota bacterium]